MLFGAAGEDGSDAGDAQFSGLFDGPLHVVELEDGEEEMEREGAAFSDALARVHRTARWK